MAGCICGFKAILIYKYELADACCSQLTGYFAAKSSAPDNSGDHLRHLFGTVIVVASMDPGVVLPHDRYTADRRRAKNGVAFLVTYGLFKIFPKPRQTGRGYDGADLDCPPGRRNL